MTIPAYDPILDRYAQEIEADERALSQLTTPQLVRRLRGTTECQPGCTCHGTRPRWLNNAAKDLTGQITG